MNILLEIALFFYLISTIGHIISLLVRRVLIAKVSTWALFSAFFVHTIYILSRWVQTGYGPVANTYESLSFVAWSISGIYLAFQIMTKTRVLGVFVSPLAFILAIGASVNLVGDIEMPEMLKGPWALVHITLSLTGEALFALAFMAGLMYLLQDSLIRKKKVHSFSRLLPPLRDLDRINHISILWGFFLLTSGIVAGSIWARTVWGSQWQWDPKQISTLFAWIIYALLLHQRIAIGWKGRKAAFLSIAAFIILLFTFVGVNIFFVTLHNFM
ncbi:MAG: c-type cytochrome biogenesis protein CcsB [Deltaproteobacteria bacterium]|nr:c-type cytochrome biogenesis protein CcsB [Deltaproteobacteria bacterium]